MLQFIQSMGPLALPIVVLGLLAVGLAAAFARRPSSKLFAQCLGTTALVNLIAALSFVLGTQRAIGGMGQVEAGERWIAAIGLSESLNGIVGSVAFTIVVTALLTVGGMGGIGLGRRSRPALDTA